MRPVLRPGSPLLRRDATHLQLGTEPGHALVLDEAAPLAALLTALDGVRTADDPGLDGSLVEALHTAGVVVDSEVWRAETGLESEAAHLLTRGLDADATRRQIASRRRAEVRIVGDDPLAGSVADLLEASGVGTISTGSAPTSRADLVIVAVEGEAARDLADECVRADVAHFVAATRDGCGVVGPLVLPGRTACLRCLDIERSAVDTAWPAIVAQLPRPLSTPAGSLVRAVSAVLDAATAVVTVRDALAQLAGDVALTHNATLRIGPDLSQLRRYRWSLQPGCGCALLS
jgi:hypothetical protein